MKLHPIGPGSSPQPTKAGDAQRAQVGIRMNGHELTLGDVKPMSTASIAIDKKLIKAHSFDAAFADMVELLNLPDRPTAVILEIGRAHV